MVLVPEKAHILMRRNARTELLSRTTHAHADNGIDDNAAKLIFQQL